MKRFSCSMLAVVLALAASGPAHGALTAYYDFEGDFNDHPGAGVNADDLVNVTGGFLAADPATGAKGRVTHFAHPKHQKMGLMPRCMPPTRTEVY